MEADIKPYFLVLLLIAIAAYADLSVRWSRRRASN